MHRLFVTVLLMRTETQFSHLVISVPCSCKTGMTASCKMQVMYWLSRSTRKLRPTDRAGDESFYVVSQSYQNAYITVQYQSTAIL